MSLTRKVLRFGRTIGIIISIMELSKSKGNKAIVLNKILMNISCFLYFLVDHTHWFCKVNSIFNLDLSHPKPITRSQGRLLE